MEQRFEDAVKRAQENNLSDLIFHRKYSSDENLQKAFLDGYAIGILSSLVITASQNSDNFGNNAILLQKAINGDKDAIKELEKIIKQ